ncbi:hypothetical protein [Brumimicrobium mesophilum]|uniref:hypothetical protein n=1 Tax=Brumimicrobium mesophilum TaxID=392717 RepID=UPI000D14464C|nr:hypothetical protein [Brumimicrobium mesophilum]
MRIIFTIVLTSSILLGCGYIKEDRKLNVTSVNLNMKPKSLLENVKLAINPQFQDWVLFENGTYIILDDVSQISDVKSEAIKLMKEFGPVSTGGPAGDFGVTYLNETEGWTVSGHGYGMYTYVNPSELDSNSPDDATIGLYGRSKRHKDGQEANIIYINSAKSN